MAEEIPAGVGQADPSYVSAMGGNGRVDRVVRVEDCLLAGSERFSSPLHFLPSGVLTPSFTSGISVSSQGFDIQATH